MENLWENLEEALLSLESKKEAEDSRYYCKIKNFLKEILQDDLKIKIEIKPQEPNCDLLIKKGEDILCLIEFKRLCSVEFNANVINKGSKKCLILCSNGILPNWGKENLYPNKSQDGVGQIRGYFYKFLDKNGFIKKEKPFAILTNGFNWIIFDYRLPSQPKEIPNIVSSPLNEKEVMYFLLPEELKNFKDFLKEKLSGLSNKERNKYMINKTVKILGNL